MGSFGFLGIALGNEPFADEPFADEPFAGEPVADEPFADVPATDRLLEDFPPAMVATP